MRLASMLLAFVATASAFAPGAPISGLHAASRPALLSPRVSVATMKKKEEPAPPPPPAPLTKAEERAKVEKELEEIRAARKAAEAELKAAKEAAAAAKKKASKPSKAPVAPPP